MSSLTEELKELSQDIEQLRKYTKTEASKRLDKVVNSLEAKGLSLVAEAKDKLSGKKATTAIAIASKANKKVRQVDNLAKSLIKIKSTIDAFAEQLTKEGLDDDDKTKKHKRYRQMSIQIQFFLQELNSLKFNLDKLARINNSPLTAGIGKSAGYLKKINTLLNAVSYLSDQATVNKFMENPDSYDAAKEWARHSATGFTMIGNAIESIPVPEGPMKDIRKYFSGLAKTGPKLIEAFISAVDMKIKKIEEATGAKFFHKTKHRINKDVYDPTDGKNKPEYEGAFVHLFQANVRSTSNGESLKDLMQTHRALLTNFKKSAQFRIDFLKNKVIIKKTEMSVNNNHEDILTYEEWLTTIDEHQAKIIQLGKSESSFLGR